MGQCALQESAWEQQQQEREQPPWPGTCSSERSGRATKRQWQCVR